MQSQLQEPDSHPGGRTSYVVGRDDEGHWLAVEEHGLGGGLFTTRDAALRYASFESGCARAAVVVTAEPVTLRL